jgi:three-Cys-motif partner protein
MPITDDVGHGPFTSLKMDILRKIFDMHLVITQAVLNGHNYFKQTYKYIDVTAGKGYVPETLIPGSPLVFLNAAYAGIFKKPFEAHFIELKDVNFQELVNNVRDYSQQKGWNIHNHVHFHQGNYQQVIPNFLNTIDRKEFGLVFVDHTGNLPILDSIKYISQMRPRMEILFYISARIIKRIHPLTGKSLLDYMQEIGKQHWLVRKPVKWDNLEWTFLLGSNDDIFKDYKKIDFFRLESDEAQSFFPRLNLTSKQRMEKVQPKLPLM